jgi:hypothetical protein
MSRDGDGFAFVALASPPALTSNKAGKDSKVGWSAMPLKKYGFAVVPLASLPAPTSGKSGNDAEHGRTNSKINSDDLVFFLSAR